MKTPLALALFALIFSASVPTALAKSNTANKPQDGRTADGKPDEYEKIYNRTVEGKSLDQYFAAINGGWGKNLSAMRPHLKPESSYLVLHAQEPDEVYDFRSANNFKTGMMSKGLAHMAKNTMGIGHFFLSWRCQVNGQPVEGTVGMTGELDDQFRKSMDLGWGLGTFLGTFHDGHLQTPELLNFEFENYEPLHSLAIEVDPAVCGNAIAFVKSFLFNPSKPYENFGLSMDPAKYQGGGCGSFGATVLEKSGIFGNDKIVPLFWRNIEARPSLFGYGLELPDDTTIPAPNKTGSKKINKALLFIASDWNPPYGQKGVGLHFMDPEMLLLFLKTTYHAFIDDVYRANGSLGRTLKNGPLYKTRMSQQGVIIPDGKDKESWTVESAAEQPIDANFDDRSANIVANTKVWTNKLKAQGFRAHPVMIGSGIHSNVGVILDR